MYVNQNGSYNYAIADNKRQHIKIKNKKQYKITTIKMVKADRFLWL
jgi:hypothetical protein